MAQLSSKPVLVTGAKGFVGRYLTVALRAARVPLRLASRNPPAGSAQGEGEQWVSLDVEKPDTLREALAGCDAAFYLIHRVGAGPDYPAKEQEAARQFAQAAAVAGIRRIIYLGGVVPRGAHSRHLSSRLQTGLALRIGAVPTVELRAAMIIGDGSLSWRMVRDLSRRLPLMVLPRWLRNHSWPVSIDDVVRALVVSLRLPEAAVGCYDLPGPERVSHREVLARAARVHGHRPLMMGVPVVTPRLSSVWISLVTSVPAAIASELVEGLVSDLDPTERPFWTVDGGHTLLPLNEAMQRALADARAGGISASEAVSSRIGGIGRQAWHTDDAGGEGATGLLSATEAG